MLFKKQSDSPSESIMIESRMFPFNTWKYAKMVLKNTTNTRLLLQKAWRAEVGRNNNVEVGIKDGLKVDEVFFAQKAH